MPRGRPLLVLALWAGCLRLGAASPVGVTLDGLAEGAHVHGFTVVSVYLDDTDRPLGARFVHDRSGYTFDYLRIESAPQAFIWVTSFPTSDKGEPHTQEHLLLGKGNRGRKLGSNEAMALASSSAFTGSWRTAYHFHTVAGNDAFWPVFEDHLDALLHPDYTDEEIRREVRNFGVEQSDNGTLRLEEKGTVYNEMVRTFEQPSVRMWRVAGQLVYGPSHPLALDSGGYPEAIRTMTPADIRRFHAAAYHLGNMGMIGAFPAALPLASVLDHTSSILDRKAEARPRATRKTMSETDLPKPAPAAPGTIRLVDYPYGDSTNPGPLMLVWPASRHLDETDRTLLELFLDALAGDEGTPLYKKLIDGKTRTMDVGASAVWSAVLPDQGQPVCVGLDGVRAEKLDEETVRGVRALVLAEIGHLSGLPDGDPELVAFDGLVASRATELRRRLQKVLDTPPGFGVRGTGSLWMTHLHQLAKAKGFRKSLTLRHTLASVERILAAPSNPWRERLKSWGLLETPFGVAARPSAELRGRIDAERKERVGAEIARLARVYGTKDQPATLARYRVDEDARTRELEGSARAVELPPLVAAPPMTLDDGLRYATGEVGQIPSFSATFDSMSSARIQIAFPVTGRLADEDQLFLAALPSLLGDAGVIEDGRPIAADEMRERIRREILELSVSFSSNLKSHRLELVVAGAGNGVGEVRNALGWMRRVMLSPDWRIENLPRLRDLVDQGLTSLRARTLGAEEGWVQDPRDAWWQQTWSEYLHASSFLTQAHDLHRLRWMLEDPRDSRATAEAVAFLTALADAKGLPRKDLAELAKSLENGVRPKAAAFDLWTDAAARLSPRAKTIARDAGKDLAALLPDLPDGSLAADWSYLCRQMAHDLNLGAPTAVEGLARVRARLIGKSGARLVEVGSAANLASVAADVERLARALPNTQPAARVGGAPRTTFDSRLRDHDPDAEPRPVFVGLVNRATSSGVLLSVAPSTGYADVADAAVLDYLTSNLYSGHGAHSIFMKTWAAGLAYSNGLRPHVAEGTLTYYAERCPLLPQTLRFVIEQLRKAKPDSGIARYAVAAAFGSRIAGAYEERAEQMAADLVDGLTPAVVRAFRSRVLALAERPDLAEVLFSRLEAVYGRVLPGYGALDKGGVYFAIGPNEQLTAYEDYLRAALGKDARLHRAFPRDFWLRAPLP